MTVVSIRRLLLALVALTGAVRPVSPVSRPRSNYELNRLTERLTSALLSHRSRDIYRMLTPAFTAEHSFARFDSALARWLAGRRIVRASHKIVEISGPAGYVSTWAVFEGEQDYEYIYQNWLNTPQGWQLAWLSQVFDTSFAYGQTDSLGLVRAADVGLRYVLSQPGLERFQAGLKRPDTVVIIRRGRPGEGRFGLDSLPFIWVSMEYLSERRHVPASQFFLSLALVRLMGDMAVVVVDLALTGAPGRRRGVEVYLERQGKSWRFHDVGKIW